MKWGILGAARTARKRMLPAILASGQTIAAIAGRDPAKLEQFQRDFAIPRACTEPDAVLQDPAVDAVYIALPNSMHAEWAVRGLEAGKRVLCEKPLALNVGEADCVVGAARTGVLLENFSYRRNAGDSAAICHFSARFSFEATQEHRPRFNRSLGGGSFLDLGCYAVDFAHHVFDREIEILDARATYRPDWGDADESCTVEARCGQASVHIETSFAAPPRQEFLLRYNDGSEELIPRADDTADLLRRFAAAFKSAPEDLIRWRRNAAVYEAVLARM